MSARPPRTSSTWCWPGPKGLSLFYVPKYLFDPDTLELGPRNGVFATGLEHKMGLKSSPTCELTFGAHGARNQLCDIVVLMCGGIRGGPAGALSVCRRTSERRCRTTGFGRRSEDGAPRRRPAVAGGQGRRLRACLR